MYVARDVERALGLPLATKGYWIITNSSPLAKELAKKYKNVVVIKNKEILDTQELLQHPQSVKLFKKLKNSQLLVFKNTKQIEKICSERGWKLLNPSAELSNHVEQKLTQLEWLGPLKKYVPEHKVMKCSELAWDKTTSSVLPLIGGENHKGTVVRSNGSLPYKGRDTERGFGHRFIIQFNHAHTGLGTILIESQKQINELKQKFPNREVRVTKFISGPVFTCNNVVWTKKVFTGNISYQITGLTPFTDQPFATIGNDWALPIKLLSTKQIRQIKQIATDIGKRLMKDGWKGLFGIDVIVDETNGRVYLLEINARQPASTTYESQLQQQFVIPNPRRRGEESLSQPTNGQRSLVGASLARDDNKKVTTFEAHLAALLGLRTTDYGLQEVTDGAQIIQRVIIPPQGGLTGGVRPLSRYSIKKLKNSGFKVVQYTNTKPGEDLLRIQSTKEIMKNEKELNEIGEKIKASLLPKPALLEKIDLNFIYDNKKIWKLKSPTREMPINKLLWHFDYPFWEKEGTDDWNLTPWEVIKDPEQQPTHYKKIIESNLRFPIAIMKYKGRWRVLDGLHRLAKGYIEGDIKIKVIIIPKAKLDQIIWN